MRVTVTQMLYTQCAQCYQEREAQVTSLPKESRAYQEMSSFGNSPDVTQGGAGTRVVGNYQLTSEHVNLYKATTIAGFALSYVLQRRGVLLSGGIVKATANPTQRRFDKTHRKDRDLPYFRDSKRHFIGEDSYRSWFEPGRSPTSEDFPANLQHWWCMHVCTLKG